MASNVERIIAFVDEIQKLEKQHVWEACDAFPPGRCPICLRIRMIECDQIEREITILEEEVMDALEKREDWTQALMTLAEGDIARCHRGGKWPYSRAEIEENGMIEMMLSHRLDLRRVFAHNPLRYKLIRSVLTSTYQKGYQEKCVERWSEEAIRHYSNDQYYRQEIEYTAL